MVYRLIIAGALFLSFGLGYFLAMPNEEETVILKEQLTTSTKKNKLLQESNTQLSETLGLIRRQVQTDRIAYESLKRNVDESEQQRLVLQEKFESQRALLERLKKKIENL